MRVMSVKRGFTVCLSSTHLPFQVGIFSFWKDH